MTDIIEEPIKQRTYVNTSPEKVYDTITSGKGWDAFFTTDMELDPRPDGRIVFRWKNWGPDRYSFDAPGKVLEATRPTKFVFQWGSKPTTITFELSPQGDGTLIHLTEVGYANTPEGRRNMLECAAGWGEALTLLKFYLEHDIVYTPPAQ